MTDIDLLSDDEPVEQGFVIDSIEKADWALRKKGAAEAEIERIAIYATALKTRIDARVAEILKPHIRTLEAMDLMLRPWADVEIAKGGKKSVKLISGTVGFRSSPASLQVHDEAAAVTWLKEHAPDCVRVKEEVKKAETKKLIEATGELPDGTALVPGDVRFYAEPLSPALESK